MRLTERTSEQSKEVNNTSMKEEKFKNINSESGNQEDQDEVESQFRQQRGNRHAKHCHEQKYLHHKREKVYRSEMGANFRPSRRKFRQHSGFYKTGNSIYPKPVQYQRRQHFWHRGASFSMLLHEKRYLQMRIRRLKKRLFFLTRQIESRNCYSRNHRFNKSQCRRSHARQKIYMHTYG